MKTPILAALALVSGISIACAGELTVAQVDDIDTLPCSAFQGSWDSLKEGVTLAIPLSSTNNSELFARLGERLSRCRNAETRNAETLTESLVSSVARR